MKWHEIPWRDVRYAASCGARENKNGSDAPVTDDEISLIEAEIGFAFPDAFKQFQKALRPGYASLAIQPAEPGEAMVPIGTLDRINYGVGLYLSRLDWDPPWPEGVFPFGDEAGGWTLCIDLRKDDGYGYGEVVLYRNGLDDEEEDDVEEGESAYRFSPLGAFVTIDWIVNP